jgi:hypothetical protein
MSLENIAAGLFNFDPTRSAQIGNSMGAQMMEVALRSQQMQLDAGAKWDQAALAADRNAMSRRTQMFNEMTANLNRFDEKARQNSAMEWAQGGSSGGGGGGSYSSPSLPASDYPGQGGSPSTEAAPVYYDEPTSMPGGGGFMTEGTGNPAITPTNEQSITMNAPQPAAPIGGSAPLVQAPGGKSFSMSRGTPAMNQFVTAPEVSMGSSTQSAPQEGQISFSGGAPAIRNNQQVPIAQVNSGNFPTYLETDSKSKVNPTQLHGFVQGRMANSKLNGFVPMDGERFGITTGSQQEWADYFTGLAYVESGFGTKVVGDVNVARIPGNSNGLYQLSPNDAMNYGLRDRPFTMAELQDATANVDAAIKIHEKLVTEDGVIAGRKEGGGWAGASRYWGPLRRGVTPQTQAVVAQSRFSAPQSEPAPEGGQSQIAGIAGGAGGIDAGLFPQNPTASSEPTQQPSQAQQLYGPQGGDPSQSIEAMDFEQFPEFRAAQEARTNYQSALRENTQNAAQLSGLKTQMMQVDQEIEATRGAAAAVTAGMSATESNRIAAIRLTPLLQERKRLEAGIMASEEKKREAQGLMATWEKASKDAESSWKIVQDRQRVSRSVVPGSPTGNIDPEQVMDSYMAASPIDRVKIESRFVNDAEMSKRLGIAKDFLEKQGNGGDTRTWKVGGDDYTLAEIAQFYTPTNPNSIEKPDGVQTLVESNPKLKAEVMAIQGQSAPVQETAPAPVESGADPVRAKIDALF